MNGAGRFAIRPTCDAPLQSGWQSGEDGSIQAVGGSLLRALRGGNRSRQIEGHLHSSKLVSRDNTPWLLDQEASGFRMTRFAIRGALHEVAVMDSGDPDRLSILHDARVVRRKFAVYDATTPSVEESVSALIPQGDPARTSRKHPSQCKPLGGKLEMSDSPIHQRHIQPLPRVNLPGARLRMTCTVMAP